MSRRGFTSRNGGPYAYLVNTAMELGIINLRQQSNFYFHDVQKTQKIPKIKQPKCKKSTKLKNAKKSENPEITVTFLKKKTNPRDLRIGIAKNPIQKPSLHRYIVFM